MKNPKDYCPYKDGRKCFHKDNRFTSKGQTRNCGYPKSPETCHMYLEWVEMIDMDYLEKTLIPKGSKRLKTTKEIKHDLRNNTKETK